MCFQKRQKNNIESIEKLSKLIAKPNKKLGQNFLFDKNYLKKISDYIKTENDSVLVEIGSGYGSLTNILSGKRVKKILSIEKDFNLYNNLVLNNKETKIEYIFGDALKIDWDLFVKKYGIINYIIGNLPYHIANSLIVDLLLKYKNFKCFYFLIQKEVAQKWNASVYNHQAKYSALSIFINYLCKTSLLMTVPKEIFVPAPFVDGSLIKIEIKESVYLEEIELKDFLSFLKKCFSARRKKLLKNLMKYFPLKKWGTFFIEQNLPENIRPQNISPEQYFELFSFSNQNFVP